MISQCVDTCIYLAAGCEDAAYAVQLLQDNVTMINLELTTMTYQAGCSPRETNAQIHSDEQCIKTDYSYLMHGKCLLQNTYGAGVFNHLSILLYFWQNSGLFLSDEAVRELTNLILDGYMLMRFREAFPMMTLGRDVGSADERLYHVEENHEATVHILEVLLEKGCTYRRDELLAALERVSKPMETDHFSRTKFFWQADFLSHNRPGYQFTVHGVSNRIKRPESILGKNIQGMFLGDGCYNLLKSGYEYEGLQPYLNWRRLPGTTVTCGQVELNPEVEIDTKIDTLYIYGGAVGTTAFVGGVSDEQYGLFAMEYHHLGVKAKKSWFCFDEGVVCLGAGICSENGEGVFTTLNQCHSSGDSQIDGQPAAAGEQILSRPRHVLSGGVGYLFLEPAEQVYFADTERTGAWNLVDCQSGTPEPVSGKVFLLGIDHGKQPEQAQYAYMLLPECDGEELQQMAEHPTVEILENSADCQAVWHRETSQLQAVFYQKGSLQVCGITVSVSEPCALLLKLKDDSYRIWLSNPLHQEADITVTLSDEHEESIHFSLREGPMKNNLGRPRCYDSLLGFLPYQGAMGDNGFVTK